MLRQRDLLSAGVAPEAIARMVREQKIVRAARGLYALPGVEVSSAHTLAEAVLMVPRGVVCLISALQFHEMTLQTPSSVWMGIELGSWRPRIDYPAMRFVRFPGRALTDGVEHHRIDGVDVAITNPARTVVDCFRHRAKVGIDVAIEGLREGFRKRRITSDELWRYGREFRVWSVMRPYVETIRAA